MRLTMSYPGSQLVQFFDEASSKLKIWNLSNNTIISINKTLSPLMDECDPVFYAGGCMEALPTVDKNLNGEGDAYVLSL
jgi:hypothetical protein